MTLYWNLDGWHVPSATIAGPMINRSMILSMNYLCDADGEEGITLHTSSHVRPVGRAAPLSAVASCGICKCIGPTPHSSGYRMTPCV